MMPPATNLLSPLGERTKVRGRPMNSHTTKKLPVEGFKRPRPPLIRMDEGVRKKVNALFGENRERKITCRAEANAKAEDGCRREGEGGETFQPVAADARRLKLVPPRIPTAFCPKAQGCEERAALENRVEISFNPNGVVSLTVGSRLSFINVTVPRRSFVGANNCRANPSQTKL